MVAGGLIDYSGYDTPSSYLKGSIHVSYNVKEKLKYDMELYKIAQDIFNSQGEQMQKTVNIVQQWDNTNNNAVTTDNDFKYPSMQEILAFSEIDKPCILNGEFDERPPSLNWYSVLADLSVTDGVSGKFSRAIKAERRENAKRSGIWQNIRPDCLQPHQ
eukprot:269770-Ditylum_brightwellii.AAC.1